MSNVYLVRTNQKVNFARIHLDALAASHESNGWSKHAEIESYNESVLFHLASAYGAFLREVAEKYRFVPEQVAGIHDLVSLLESWGRSLQRLRSLRSLSRMKLAGCTKCWPLTAPAGKPLISKV